MNPRTIAPASPRRTRGLLLLFALFGILLAVVSPAAAHGELESTIPEKNATLNKPTDHIIINFTEPPAKPSQIVVRDGCDANIIDEVEFEDRVAHVFLTDGQPGKWKVSYQVVSAADGHQTKGSYSLNVKGKADCSAGSGNDDGKGGGRDNGGDDGTAAGPGGAGAGGEESSFPIVPVALGSAIVIGLALVARRVAG